MWKIKRPRSKLRDDRISGLPDEIIESILSQLTLKEAVKTSVLSRRWKNLWVFTTALSFDVVGYGTKPRKVKSTKIASGVNHALELHQAPTIESIQISFDFKSLYSSVVNGWIKFAIEKRVQSFELRDVGRNGVRLKYYTFPRQLLGHPNLNFLIAVHLEYLRVTDEVFHDFLLKCPLLERLSVVGSLFVVNLIVAGPSLSLKYLNISDCCMLKSIEISAPNLVSFKFFGSGRVSMLLKNVPLLVELFYGTLYSGQSFKIRPFFNYFSELRSLTLDFEVESMQNFTDFPELSNLRNLEFRVLSKYSSRNYDLLGFMSILKACPILCSFKIYLRTTFSISSQMKKTICSRMECPLKCLKEVEFIGFVGGSADVEFAMVLLENASSLEKITISDLGGFRRKCTKDSERQWALDCALNLKLPRGAKLVIV